jgi:hypothetical protein
VENTIAPTYVQPNIETDFWSDTLIIFMLSPTYTSI